jgi:hypothetical protein
MTTDEAVNVVSAVTRYAYNVDGDEFARVMYGRSIEDAYAKEKFALMQRSLVNFFGALDTGNQARFVAAALKRYPMG